MLGGWRLDFWRDWRLSGVSELIVIGGAAVIVFTVSVSFDIFLHSLKESSSYCWGETAHGESVTKLGELNVLVRYSEFPEFFLYPPVVDSGDWELVMSEPVSHFIGDWAALGLLEIE